MSNDEFTFGQRLKYARKMMRFTQEELSKRADIQKTNIRKYEANTSNPSLERAHMLASALGIYDPWVLGVKPLPEMADEKEGQTMEQAKDTQNTFRWIPIKEQQPPMGEKVMTLTRGEVRREAYFCDDCAFVLMGDGGFNYYRREEFTHWFPMPIMPEVTRDEQ